MLLVLKIAFDHKIMKCGGRMNHSVSIFINYNPYIRDIGLGTVREVWTHPTRCIDFNVFLFIISGYFQVCEGDQEYILQDGDILFLKKGVKHWGHPQIKEGTKWYWVHFYDNEPIDNLNNNDTIFLDKFTETSLLLSPDHYKYKIQLPKVMTARQPQYLEAKLRTIWEIYKSRDPMRLAMLGLKINEIFLELIQQSKQDKKMTSLDLTVERIISLVD